MASFLFQFAAALLLPVLITLLAAQLLARRAQLDETRYVDEPHRGFLFGILSVVIAAPIVWLLDPIATSISTNIPRGVVPGGLYLLFVVPAVPWPADNIYIGTIKRRLAARRRAGRRQHCGYDLTGNTSGRCPECGTSSE